MESSPETFPYRRATRVIGVVLLVYAILVATHLGEFWPFSIYPMFSRAGQPWSRAVVRDISHGPEAIAWEPVDAAALPGEPVALDDYGVDPIDLANYVSKTRIWTDARVGGLRTMFRADRLQGQRLLVMRATGELTPSDSVILRFEPYVAIDREGAVVNPTLKRTP